MSEEKSSNADVSRLGFVFKKIPISPTAMAYWLSVPEFKSEIEKRIAIGETIDSRNVCGVMKEVYSQYESLRGASSCKPDFNYRLARRGILQIERGTNNE